MYTDMHLPLRLLLLLFLYSPYSYNLTCKDEPKSEYVSGSGYDSGYDSGYSGYESSAPVIIGPVATLKWDKAEVQTSKVPFTYKHCEAVVDKKLINTTL